MILRGKEILFHYAKVADAERLTAATKRLQERADELEKSAKEGWGSNVKTTIDVFREYLNTATGQDILEGCDDIMEAEDAYYDFLGEVKQQREAYEARRKERIARYTALKEKVK